MVIKCNKERINDKTKFTPLLLIPNPCKILYACYVYCFVCALLSFCLRKFSEKSKTQEPEEIILKCTSNVLNDCCDLLLLLYLFTSTENVFPTNHSTQI